MVVSRIDACELVAVVRQLPAELVQKRPLCAPFHESVDAGGQRQEALVDVRPLSGPHRPRVGRLHVFEGTLTSAVAAPLRRVRVSARMKHARPRTRARSLPARSINDSFETRAVCWRVMRTC